MAKPIKILTKSAEETKKIGERFARELLTYRGSTSIVVSLDGELGAGKTTFTQGFARGLGIKENLRSPTFVIMRAYSVKRIAYSNLIHIDAYRIIAKDLKNLGWKELVSRPRNIILIEWGNRVSKILPRGAIKVKLKHGGLAHERALEISNFQFLNL